MTLSSHTNIANNNLPFCCGFRRAALKKRSCSVRLTRRHLVAALLTRKMTLNATSVSVNCVTSSRSTMTRRVKHMISMSLNS